MPNGNSIRDATASVVLGFIAPWMILGFSFVIAGGAALNDPAWQASVGDIVDRREVPAAVTLLSIGYTLTYMIALVNVWRCKWKVRSSLLPRESMRTAIYDGMRFTAMSSEIKTAIARGTFFGLSGIAILALLPLVSAISWAEDRSPMAPSWPASAQAPSWLASPTAY
jgi:hypothetical protein